MIGKVIFFPLVGLVPLLAATSHFLAFSETIKLVHLRTFFLTLHSQLSLGQKKYTQTLVCNLDFWFDPLGQRLTWICSYRFEITIRFDNSSHCISTTFLCETEEGDQRERIRQQLRLKHTLNIKQRIKVTITEQLIIKCQA